MSDAAIEALQEPDSLTFYVIEAAIADCSAEIYLNDIPVILLSPDGVRHFGGPMNLLTIDGRNELSMVINPGPKPDAALTGAPRGRERQPCAGARAVAKLARYPYGSVVGGPQGKTLLQLEWNAPASGRPVIFPRVEAVAGDLGHVWGQSWAWQNAERLDNAGTYVGELLEALKSLQFSLEAVDVDAYLAFTQPREADMARAYGTSLEERADLIRDSIEDDATEANWGFGPLQEARFSLRRCADGRVIEMIANDWRHILRQLPDAKGNQTCYKMSVGRIDGAWRALL